MGGGLYCDHSEPFGIPRDLSYWKYMNVCGAERGRKFLIGNRPDEHDTFGYTRFSRCLTNTLDALRGRGKGVGGRTSNYNEPTVGESRNDFGQNSSNEFADAFALSEPTDGDEQFRIAEMVLLSERLILRSCVHRQCNSRVDQPNPMRINPRLHRQLPRGRTIDQYDVRARNEAQPNHAIDRMLDDQIQTMRIHGGLCP